MKMTKQTCPKGKPWTRFPHPDKHLGELLGPAEPQDPTPPPNHDCYSCARLRESFFYRIVMHISDNCSLCAEGKHVLLLPGQWMTCSGHALFLPFKNEVEHTSNVTLAISRGGFSTSNAHTKNKPTGANMCRNCTKHCKIGLGIGILA